MNSSILYCPAEGCRRMFTRSKNLDRHIKALHSEDHPYKCLYCDKPLSSKQNLKEHISIHTGERPYACREFGCTARFRQGSQLCAHKRLHRALRQASDQREVRAVKVTYTQLTSLLARDSDFLYARETAPKLLLSDVAVALSPITSLKNLGPLPEVPNLFQ